MNQMSHLMQFFRIILRGHGIKIPDQYQGNGKYKWGWRRALRQKNMGKKFVDLINNYVEENSITRPDDLIIKSTGANSALKLYLIQSIDRKLL